MDDKDIYDATALPPDQQTEVVTEWSKRQEVFQIVDEGKGGRWYLAASSWDELRGLAGDGRHFIVVVMEMRPGALTFIQQLEWQEYEPGTERNKLFQMFRAKWENDLYFVIVVPLKHKQLIANFAPRVGMRIADGVPTVIQSRDGKVEPTFFPVQGPNVWTLENRAGSPVYEFSKPDSARAAVREECHQVQEFHERMMKQRKSS